MCCCASNLSLRRDAKESEEHFIMKMITENHRCKCIPPQITAGFKLTASQFNIERFASQLSGLRVHLEFTYLVERLLYNYQELSSNKGLLCSYLIIIKLQTHH